MHRNRRVSLPGLIWWVLAVCPLLGLQQSSTLGNDLLNTLVADYKSHGLPMPPDSARLAILQTYAGSYNGIRTYDRNLVWIDNSAGESHLQFWIGVGKEPTGDRLIYEISDPQKDGLALTESIDSSSYDYGSGLFPDFALAIQCAARGMNECALLLLERSSQEHSDFWRGKRFRKMDEREKLALLAWHYWCERFCYERSDRQFIVERLEKLLQGPFGLNSVAYQNTLDDMRATLVTAAKIANDNHQHDTVEYLVDRLIDAGLEGGWGGRVATISSIGRSDAYRDLAELGYEAVPTLLQHTHDFRLTRYVESDQRGIWHVRIADLVRELLNDLAKEELAYDFLIREGRGKCVDQTHALHWWKSNKPSGDGN